MKSQLSGPRYTCRGIFNDKALAAALRMPIGDVRRVAGMASTRYRLAKEIIKPSGEIRLVYDALPDLKAIQRKIQDQFLARVEFPAYLTGSLKGRDQYRNASIHLAAKVIVTEDIANFFPSTKEPVVYKVWRGFFGFGEDVSRLLTALTTKDGSLPQGAITSSYLANLAFWDKEPSLVQRLSLEGITYSRYVDDITVSSADDIDRQKLSWCISQLIGMMGSAGMRPKRQKQTIVRSNSRLTTTKLVVNVKPSMATEERGAIRAAVFALEQAVAKGAEGVGIRKELRSVGGRVARMKRMHPAEAARLRSRIEAVRIKVSNAGADDQ